ncbi:NADH-quinone oxidoreductase subunit C [Paenibacillus sp. UNC499MF]|uniref:NADH-quinone oxidoreductase subunit C n=1 Tax=Paenibacillus sp. UNC499MF TaxID=1502751 RepID=UPI00089F8BD0|nr:NADH-quinone oxidoreductase subunit C [Paenibacillus sp. UNC499MF]SEG62353.1 NADH-quinone oxidoreductase subunit C [Paenibacillus sp. UNC499MF]
MTDKEKEKKDPQEADIQSKPTKSDENLEANTIEYKEKQGILSKEENKELHTIPEEVKPAGNDTASPARSSERSASEKGTGGPAPETPASGAAQRTDANRAAARSAAADESGGTVPAAAANTAVPTEGTAAVDGGDKAKAAAEARAARAAARAAKTAAPAEDAPPKPPSPNQPLLDRLVEILKGEVAGDAVDEAFINEIDGHRPFVVIRGEHWVRAAEVFLQHEELQCGYLRSVSGVDLGNQLEVVYHLLSIPLRQEYGVRVRTEREAPSVPSVASVWPTADWNEREIYDLLGIEFPGHPNLTRIMMPDEWVGHPLRKDYEAYDPEV